MRRLSLSVLTSPARIASHFVSSHPSRFVKWTQHLAPESGTTTSALSPSTRMRSLNLVSNRYAAPSSRATMRTAQSPKSTRASYPLWLMRLFL